MSGSRGLCPEGEGGSTHAPQRELRLRRPRVSMGESCRAVRFVRRIPSRRVLLSGAALASLTALLTPPPQALASPSLVPTPSVSLGVPAQVLLAELDHRNMPNFKNVSANFRGLVFDPGNRYSIPFHGGTSGLLVRTDLVRKPVEHWVDPWDSKEGGRPAGWPSQHSLVPIALMADGHARDSVDPDDLREAAARLGWLKEHAILVANEAALDFMDPATRDNVSIFPPPADLVNATSLPPRSAEGHALWNQVWVETIGSVEAGS